MKLKRRYKILIVVLILIIAGIIYYSRSKSKKEEYLTAKVAMGDLSQIVSATGTITPPSEINLAAQIAGKIEGMDVAIGDKVLKDQVLAKLEGKDLEIKVKEAAANLSAARADFNKLLAGSKDEDVAVSVANVTTAEANYNNYLKTLEDTKKQSAQDVKAAGDSLENVKARSERDLEVAEETLASAKIALSDAKKSLENVKYTKQQAIVSTKEDALTDVDTKMFVATVSLNVVNDIITNSNITHLLSIRDISYLSVTKNYYDSALLKIKDARSYLDIAKESDNTDDIKAALDYANSALNETFNTVLNCYNVLINTVSGTNLSSTALDTYKTNIKTEQTNTSAAMAVIQSDRQGLDDVTLDYNSSVNIAETTVNTKESALNSAEINLSLAKTNKDISIKDAENNLSSVMILSKKKINDAESALNSYENQWKLMERQFDLKKSSPVSSEISLYSARVQQAEASLAASQENFDKTILKAPIDGIITKKTYEIGEQTTSNTAIYSMMVSDNYEVEVTIPESDIIKLKTGEEASVTLDSYNDDIKFTGRVIFIEPAETIIQDVVYYKVKIELDKSDYEVKSGMTANVDIKTAERKNVLMVPQKAIISNGEKKVKKVVNGKIDEVIVEAGLKGEDSMVEILSGLKEGDDVVIYEKK